MSRCKEHLVNFQNKTPCADSQFYITSLHQHYMITNGTRPEVKPSEDIGHHRHLQVHLGKSQHFMTPLCHDCTGPWLPLQVEEWLSSFALALLEQNAPLQKSSQRGMMPCGRRNKTRSQLEHDAAMRCGGGVKALVFHSESFGRGTAVNCAMCDIINTNSDMIYIYCLELLFPTKL